MPHSHPYLNELITYPLSYIRYHCHFLFLLSVSILCKNKQIHTYFYFSFLLTQNILHIRCSILLFRFVLFSLNRMSWKSFHSSSQRSSSLSITAASDSILWIYHSLPISCGRKLRCFSFFAIANIITMNNFNYTLFHFLW